MPYNPRTNKWFNTTNALNKERTWKEKDFSKMTDSQLLAAAQKDNNKETARQLCYLYRQLVDEKWQGRKVQSSFKWDIRQETLAQQLLNLGYTLESFKRDASKLLDYRLSQNQDPIFSLKYFVTRKEKMGQPMDVQGIVNKTVASLRMK